MILPIAAWAAFPSLALDGRYGNSDGVTRMDVDAQGQATWTSPYTFDDWAHAELLTIKGTLRQEGHWVVFEAARDFVARNPDGRNVTVMPKLHRWYLSLAGGTMFLLDKDDFLSVINHVNWSHPHEPFDGSLFLHSPMGSTPHDTIEVDHPEDLIEPAYRRFLQPVPLAGHITALGPIKDSEEDFGPAARRVTMTRHAARCVFDRGNADNVMEGMTLYVGPKHRPVRLDKVGEHASEGMLAWYEEPMAVGEAVSSAVSNRP